MITYTPTTKGFTIIEMLVAILILLLAVVAPLSIMIKAMSTAVAAKERVIAVYLAQEGIEVAHYLRDEDALEYVHQLTLGNTTYDPWGWVIDTTQVDGNCFNASGCGVDIETPNFKACSALDGCLLSIVSGDHNQYLHNSNGTPTKFTRKVYMTSSGNHVLVRVEVTWNSDIFGTAHTLDIQTYLYNQYKLNI